MSSEDSQETELAEKFEELQEKVEEQEQKIEELEDREQETSKLPENVSRRSFMKMLGLGAGGLALSSQASAAWLSLNNDVSGGGGSTQTLSDVLSEGNDISGSDIVDGGTTVWDTSNSYIPASQIQQGDGSGLDADSVDSSEPPFGAPSNTIVIWSGSVGNIPSGWVLCDGNNSTPNLQDRFVVGAGSSYSVDGTGGSQTHTLSSSEMASHSHTIGTWGDSWIGDGNYDQTIAVPGTGGTSTSNTGGDSAHENRPPYYALAYIMKT